MTAPAPSGVLPTIIERTARLDPAEPMLVHFLSGREETAELMIRLALKTGYPLIEIYEQIRATLSHGSERLGSRSILDNELDESLVRLVARLRPPVASRPVWNTCIVSLEGRGVPASVSHLMLEAGMASIVVSAGAGERPSGVSPLI